MFGDCLSYLPGSQLSHFWEQGTLWWLPREAAGGNGFRLKGGMGQVSTSCGCSHLVPPLPPVTSPLGLDACPCGYDSALVPRRLSWLCLDESAWAVCLLLGTQGTCL